MVCEAKAVSSVAKNKEERERERDGIERNASTERDREKGLRLTYIMLRDNTLSPSTSPLGKALRKL